MGSEMVSVDAVGDKNTGSLHRCSYRDFAICVILETAVAVLCSLIVIKILERVKWIKALFYPSVLLKHH